MSKYPVTVNCKLNNYNVSFEIDSGSHISTIKYSDALKMGVAIQSTSIQVRGYSGAPINVRGKITLNVKFNGIDTFHSFIVVPSNFTNLLGRDLCGKLKIAITFQDNVNNISSMKYDILCKYKDYFSETYRSSVREKVNLSTRIDCKPKFCKSREIPIRLRDDVKKELDRLVDNNILTQVFSSEWASPIVSVRKENGSLRICGDFSVSVNQFLDNVHSSLPTIDEVIATMGNAKVFSKIDLANAFLQLPLDDQSKHLTTITTPFGLYMYNFLPFGLKSSPGLFQTFMTKLLNGISNVLIYQDDVLCMDSDVISHKRTVDKVLSRLKDAGMKLNVDKCAFFVSSVSYLGHIFDEDGVHPDPEKIRAVIDAPIPTNVKQVQSFVGLVTFYNRFVPHFTHTMHPIYNLLKKGLKFQWGPSQQQAFDSIKELLCDNSLLKLFNSDYETLLETDSSATGIAAVLFQRKDASVVWHPVQYASRSLNKAEQNYSNIEREALSIVFGTEKFKKFLLGSKFTIHNDHAPLKTLFNCNAPVPTTCSSRIQRWSLKLSQFDYILEYSKGSLNVHSDFLSRHPLPDTVQVHEPYELVFTLASIENMENIPISCSDIGKATDADPTYCVVKNYIRCGIPSKLINPNLKKLKPFLPHLSIMKGCVMFKDRVFVPPSLRPTVLNSIHKGHVGMVAMKSIARVLFWYPGLDSDIENTVRECHICHASRSRPPQNSKIQWAPPTRSWSRVHIDHFFLENKTILIAIDAQTRYIECELVSSTSTSETIDALRMIFSRNGLCDILVSDNATSFTSYEFKEFIKNNGIHHVTPPPYSPSSNGSAERAVRVIKDLMKKNKGGTFKGRLARVLFTYRVTPHSVTNTSPSVALNNRRYITVKDRINPHFYAVDSKILPPKQLPQYDVGQTVMAQNFSVGEKWCHATVVERIGINVYNVYVASFDSVWKRHSNQLFPVATDRCDKNMNYSDDPQNTTNLPFNDSSNDYLRKSVRVRNPVERYGINN